ncbi:CTP synthase [Mesomycoplasma conjunctivae]|uniref:CTP synthase n=1 Tax=Mesomycoplasma conjunctivae TaxID=45361 RepID=UPI003DA27BF9
MSKFIFITGGVLSGVGKGVAVASLANLLKSCSFSVFIVKLDPYLNVDPGVLSPYEHGEVYVTEDGGETDLDLGHYERFVNQNFWKDSNHTSGKILLSIIEKERQGYYNGKTVQYIPHVTDEIILRLKSIETKYQPDFILVEIGGTVGDIESNPFYYAASQLSVESEFESKEQKVFFIHTTYVPFLATSGDFKTKPTQFSIANLSSMGIKPNAVFLRLDSKNIDESVTKKVANSSFLNTNQVIAIPNLDTIYKLPLMLSETKILDLIFNHFKLEYRKPNLASWQTFYQKVVAKKQFHVKIAALGKYTQFLDAYKSIIEAFKISGAYQSTEVQLEFFDTSDDNIEFNITDLNNYDGVVILPGFGARGFENKVKSAQFCYENDIPTFGICLGMQAMSVAQARRRGIKNANSAEFIQEFPNQVSILDFNRKDGANLSIGGTLRLGGHRIKFANNSKIRQIYGREETIERHRHRFEIVRKFIDQIEDQSFKFSGLEAEQNLVEACEDNSKSFYIGVQYHPEFVARPLKSHPLFDAFIKAAISKKYKQN